MPIHALVAKAATTVVTGVVGAATYDATRRLIRRAPLREGAVVAATWGLRGTRKAEEAAETVRLNTADIVAEARTRIGEEVPPPGAATVAHDHDHDH